MNVGRFSQLRNDNHLILHITNRMASGQSLNSLKFEELKILRLTCLLLFGKGLEIMIVRETLHNSGTCDNVILNRKTSTEYWVKLYAYIRKTLPSFPLSRIFNERSAAALSRELSRSRHTQRVVTGFLRNEIGFNIDFPEDLTADGNFLFSLGTVYSHRLFRLARFFHRYWGMDAYEPAVREICKKMWFFYLIAWGHMKVSEEAFDRQRTQHEFGVFEFVIRDYRNFTGTLHRASMALSPDTRDAINELLNTNNLNNLY